jgi:hypothetical protein
LRVEGKADRTLARYGQSITYFSQWLVEQGLPADLPSMTRDNVLNWLDALRARDLTAGTIRTRWRGLRRFVNWLCDCAAEFIYGGLRHGVPAKQAIIAAGPRWPSLSSKAASQANGTDIALVFPVSR